MTEADAGFAPAKVNLYLHVTGRRADGYHLLDSLVVFAGVGDTVAVARDEDLSLVVEGPLGGNVPAGPDNLVLRAADLLRRNAGRPRLGARIGLNKVLPAAAGLGGGSADAAAALRTLNALWGLGLSNDGLRGLGVRLGADVPVCIGRQPALMSGIGEVLEPAPNLPPFWMVLVNPGVPVSTASVFAGMREFTPPPPVPNGPMDLNSLAQWLSGLRNDLEAPAHALAPPIGDALAALRAARDCLLARMSGSGATCFGVFAEAGTADAAAASIARSAPHWWVSAAPLCGTFGEATEEARVDAV